MYTISSMIYGYSYFYTLGAGGGTSDEPTQNQVPVDQPLPPLTEEHDPRQHGSSDSQNSERAEDSRQCTASM